MFLRRREPTPGSPCCPRPAGPRTRRGVGGDHHLPAARDAHGVPERHAVQRGRVCVLGGRAARTGGRHRVTVCGAQLLDRSTPRMASLSATPPSLAQFVPRVAAPRTRRCWSQGQGPQCAAAPARAGGALQARVCGAPWHCMLGSLTRHPTASGSHAQACAHLLRLTCLPNPATAAPTLSLSKWAVVCVRALPSPATWCTPTSGRPRCSTTRTRRAPRASSWWGPPHCLLLRTVPAGRALLRVSRHGSAPARALLTRDGCQVLLQQAGPSSGVGSLPGLGQRERQDGLACCAVLFVAFPVVLRPVLIEGGGAGRLRRGPPWTESGGR